MPDHCCSAAFCLTEITVPSQPQSPSAFSGSLLRLKLSPRPILLQFAAAIQPTSSLYQPSPLQTLDSIDSRVNSYPFLPYFIHQRFSPNQLHHLIPYPAHLH
ncbi:hypothetical protein PAPYR_9625 [Paratrimastix pyriformis]|uniref:Uncharacterized protein n=1 Tax=Paratrimastix pyriformis TaxID=342808 RepID=A0ABQ8UDI1_9EUKA|nr:hypothetical protein PAPYR_9625 [Paratrimastix pyriformis]